MYKIRFKRKIQMAAFLFCIFPMILSGCESKESESVFEVKAITKESELKKETYYVKSKDTFYPVAVGTKNYEDGTLNQSYLQTSIQQTNEIDSKQILTYIKEKEDQFIPTLYQDEQLILNTEKTIPNTFLVERYEDLGYSIGAVGLKEMDSKKYGFTYGSSNINPNSSFAIALKNTTDQNHLKIQDEDIIIIDKIGDLTITEETITRAGTIKGLIAAKEYMVYAYIGSQSIQFLVTADTHVFSLYEKYELSNYNYLDGKNYIEIKLPDYFHSGFYTINGIGMFRYVAQEKEKGIAGINFNSPYFLGQDADGNLITADQIKEESINQSNEIESYDYEYETVLDCSQQTVTYQIKYSELEVPSGQTLTVAEQNSQPTIIAISPDGQKYGFTQSTEQKNCFECTIEMPLSGNWKLGINGMNYRTFRVSQSYTSGHADSLVHEGSGKAIMKRYVPNALQDGIFLCTWENKENAAAIKIIAPDGTQYGKEIDPSQVMLESYGEMLIHLGEISEGVYTIEVSGEQLGRVRVQYQENEEFQANS